MNRIAMWVSAPLGEHADSEPWVRKKFIETCIKQGFIYDPSTVSVGMESIDRRGDKVIAVWYATATALDTVEATGVEYVWAIHEE